MRHLSEIPLGKKRNKEIVIKKNKISPNAVENTLETALVTTPRPAADNTEPVTVTGPATTTIKRP